MILNSFVSQVWYAIFFTAYAQNNVKDVHIKELETTLMENAFKIIGEGEPPNSAGVVQIHS